MSRKDNTAMSDMQNEIIINKASDMEEALKTYGQYSNFEIKLLGHATEDETNPKVYASQEFYDRCVEGMPTSSGNPNTAYIQFNDKICAVEVNTRTQSISVQPRNVIPITNIVKDD